MANLTSVQIKDSYQSVLTTSETTSNPTTGTLQNGKGTAITTLTVSGTVNATTLGGTLSTASQPNVTSVGTLTSATISGDLTVDTSTLKVDSANNRVGIGTSTPNGSLHILNSSAGTTPSNYLRIEGSVANNSNYPGIELKGGTLSDGGYPNITLSNGGLAIILQSGFGASSNEERNQISLNASSGITFLTSTSGTATERMRITASGVLELTQGQIKFPATQVASADPNTLDDYEEGTYIPTLSVSSGSITLDTDFNELSYTKIGNTVLVRGLVLVSSVSSPTGTAVAFTLPFALVDTPKTSGRMAGSCVTLISGVNTARAARNDGGGNNFLVFMDASTVAASTGFYLGFQYKTT